MQHGVLDRNAAVPIDRPSAKQLSIFRVGADDLSALSDLAEIQRGNVADLRLALQVFINRDDGVIGLRVGVNDRGLGEDAVIRAGNQLRAKQRDRRVVHAHEALHRLVKGGLRLGRELAGVIQRPAADGSRFFLFLSARGEREKHHRKQYDRDPFFHVRFLLMCSICSLFDAESFLDPSDHLRRSLSITPLFIVINSSRSVQ